jgi:hypothetical protein
MLWNCLQISVSWLVICKLNTFGQTFGHFWSDFWTFLDTFGQTFGHFWSDFWTFLVRLLDTI